MVDRCTLPGQGRAPEVARFNCITRTSAQVQDSMIFSTLSLLTWSGGVTKTESCTILESWNQGRFRQMEYSGLELASLKG